MGEVYRARDTRLGRDVAIKVLPEEFARDKERLDRFEREARLLAQVNHSNIATLHGLEEHDGQQFLVMELVEGETLAERIARGPLPIEEAIPLFIRIADGLEAAHDKGIIRRDLKPANLKIGPDGKPKILDFGLAKAFLPEESVSAETSQSPTLTKGTALGAIMGTASYMSPEQARGKAVDKRTDIWAMGVCLFEALSGNKPFDGETVTDVLAAVVKNVPSWESLPAETPSAVRRLLQRSLEKKARDRIHHAADARIELEHADDTIALDDVGGGGKALATAVSIAILATIVAAWSLIRSPASAPVEITRTAIPVEPGLRFGNLTLSGSVAISANGRHLAYVGWLPGSSERLYLRATDSLQSQIVEGSGHALMPFFSPDSQWLGFAASGRLMKIAVSGGASVPIADMQGPRGASWCTD
ncbi:MAG: hypothetical protein BMS9Abin37_0855 [Acidobacteriota bacterium]|nr:MAG: hypothetical protein BMS9Abin37_0855 [Acidobacteriota bacterium]